MILPEIFRDVLKDYKDVDFVIVGDGELHQPLEKAFKEKGVKVFFTGTVKPSEVANYMRAMDIMILPSLNEGWPCVIKEAQACGCYVIGSNNGGIPEAIGEHGSVYPLDENFTNHVIQKILELFKNHIPSEKISKNLDLYHWEQTIKEEIKCYSAAPK